MNTLIRYSRDYREESDMQSKNELRSNYKLY